MKDWTGNKKSTFAILGASNHTEKERADFDFYASNPKTLILLLAKLKEDNINLNQKIWECACGQGHLSKVLLKEGFDVVSSDLIDRGFGQQLDFLKTNGGGLKVDILTNPPYKFAKQFVEHGLEMIDTNFYVVMLLKIQFLESKERRSLFDSQPPKYIYVFSERQTCYANGDFSKKLSSATCYAWFIWQKGFKGDSIVRWI